MKKQLYLECYSGISGDMAVAALLDLGADRKVLETALDSLSLEGFQIQIGRVKKSGLDACDFRVILDETHENHDHHMEYLHAHEGAQHSNEDMGHVHLHESEPHTHEEPAHVHRGLFDILAIIGRAEISQRAKETAEKIFTVIAEAEAKAHGVPMEQVHFHEVGAVDSIVDIVAAAVCLDNLDITEVIIPKLYEGCGSIRCQHGVIPVPVPAVVHIAQAHGLTLHMTNIQGELVTPTGAAIAAVIRTCDKLPTEFKVEKTGLGAGKRKYECTGVLRAMLIQETAQEEDVIYKLESNIDDCGGEILGYVQERLFEAGAKDVYYTPVYMKKNRPAYQLNVICEEQDIKKLEQIILEETTTIGIRRMRMERTVLKRESKRVSTAFGEAEVKVCTLPDGREKIYPEYSSIKRLSMENRMSYRQMYDSIWMEMNDCNR